MNIQTGLSVSIGPKESLLSGFCHTKVNLIDKDTFGTRKFDWLFDLSTVVNHTHKQIRACPST